MDMDLLGGGMPASSQPSGGQLDLFGGSTNNNDGGIDLFSSAPSSSSFPSFIAYEDSVIDLGFDLKRERPNQHLITAHFRNKGSTSLSGVSL